jgi:uncharacterized protein YbbC (DUF1343 family)
VNRQLFRPVKTGVVMLDCIRRISGKKFQWIRSGEKKDRYFIDLLAGTDMLRGAPAASYLDSCEAGRVRFLDMRKPYLLY